MSQRVTKIPWVSFSTQKRIKRWASAIFLLQCAENTRGKAPRKPLLLWYLSWTWLPGAAPYPQRSLQVQKVRGSWLCDGLIKSWLEADRFGFACELQYALQMPSCLTSLIFSEASSNMGTRASILLCVLVFQDDSTESSCDLSQHEYFYPRSRIQKLVSRSQCNWIISSLRILGGAFLHSVLLVSSVVNNPLYFPVYRNIISPSPAPFVTPSSL